MKYVIGLEESTGCCLPIVFGEEIVHRAAAKALRASVPGCTIHSAGFVCKSGKSWVVTGAKSESLGLCPQPGDESILRLFLEEGLSGLSLKNELSFLELESRKVKGRVDS